MAGAVEVVALDGLEIGGARVREPHRHDYHELVWVREGEGEHRLDGAAVPVAPRTLTVIGRGQVHVFESGRGLRGAVVRFGDELVYGGAERRAAPGWLLAGRGGRTVPVPAGDVAALEGVIAALGAEAALPPDARAAELEHHLVAVLLLWIERWYDASRIDAREPGDADVQLQRRFARLLESDFAAPPRRRPLRRRARRPARRPLARAQRGHRPLDQGADHRPRDARGRPPAALHRPHRRRGRPPRRLLRPALLLARLQAPRRRGPVGLPRARCAGSPCIREVSPLEAARARPILDPMNETTAIDRAPVLPATLRLGAVHITVTTSTAPSASTRTRSA